MSEARPARRIIELVEGQPRIVEDRWHLVQDASAWQGEPYALIPLRAALEQPQRVAAARPAGVWLAPEDEPARVAPFLESIDLIAVQFPQFTDGRGYSTAALLRRRHGWRGGLRAVGDVLRDQLHAMRRVGFDSFAVRADRSLEDALLAFADFSDAYQGAVEPELPAFRRLDDGVSP